MRRYGWQGRPLAAESLGEGRTKLRPSGHFMGWTGTHRLAAARAAGLMKIPVILINSGRPSRRPVASKTTTDKSRYLYLRSRRDPAAALLRAEMKINEIADRAGVL